MVNEKLGSLFLRSWGFLWQVNRLVGQNLDSVNQKLHKRTNIFMAIYGKIYYYIKTIHDGMWLAILPHQACYYLTSKYYCNHNPYMSESRVRQGLYPPQEEPVKKIFKPFGRVLVAGAGAGKEVLGLWRLGFQVSSFDCSKTMVEFGNKLLKKEGCEARIELAAPDECPASDTVYDAVLVGAGVYINIIPKHKRLKFLEQLRSNLRDNGPIMIGFCHRNSNTRYYDFIDTFSNFFRRLLKLDPLEKGDRLEPCFEHYFTEQEIISELETTGFRITYIDTSIDYLSQIVGLKQN